MAREQHSSTSHMLAVRLLAAPRVLYGAGLGPLLGHRFLLLVHRGRRTGRRRETVLEVLRWDGARREAVVLSALGPRSQWLRNVEAAPPIEVRIGSERFQPVVRRLTPEEGADELARFERAHRLVRPVIRKVIGTLGGIDYDGSDAARIRAAQRLPLVAFRPAAAGARASRN